MEDSQASQGPNILNILNILNFQDGCLPGLSDINTIIFLKFQGWEASNATQ